jgi:glycosyltransferase involved in cell wall biosynthesis
MAKLSAIILTKNEESMIADAIDAVDFADEIAVIDNGSTDNTNAIAERMGAHVYQCEAQSFAEKRNLGLKKAKYEWVLYLDADERLDDRIVSSIKDIVLNEKEKAAYRLNRKNFYLGNHEWPVTEKLERLFYKKHLQEWYGTVHETAKVAGEIGDIDGYILHYTHRDLVSMLNKTIAWSGIEAKLRYDAHHPKMSWWRFPRVMMTAFYDSYIKQKGYTVGTVGLIESIYQAFSMFITYARLWEMQQK